MRISDWSSDVCSSDLDAGEVGVEDRLPVLVLHPHQQVVAGDAGVVDQDRDRAELLADRIDQRLDGAGFVDVEPAAVAAGRGQALEIGRASCRARVCQYV